LSTSQANTPGRTISKPACCASRTIFIGEPDEEKRKVYEIVREAQQAGIDIVRPGVRACDVDKAVRDVVEKAGYGPQFFHRTGHGIGLALHEAPYISSSHQTVLKEGMAFSVEPGIYLHGKFGVRIEDIVVVTANGCETMTKFPRTLTVV
jgi:Xaa-Pro dipeptidase